MSMEPRGTLPRPRPRDEFRARLRADLVREAVGVLAPRPRRAPLFVLPRPAFAITMALVLLVGGAGYAAAGSLPGDPAFALKRAVEDVQVATAGDDAAKVQVLAEQLQRRLDELARVSASRPDRAPTASEEFAAAAARLARAVAALKNAPPGAKRDAALEVAETAREKHRAVLEELEEMLPPDARPGIERAMDENEQIPGRGPESPRPTRTPTRTETPRPTAPVRPAETPRTTAPTTPTPRSSPSVAPTGR